MIELAVTKKVLVQQEKEYEKVQLMEAMEFQGERDVLDALLDDNRKYTLKSVREKINSFMKGKVK